MSSFISVLSLKTLETLKFMGRLVQNGLMHFMRLVFFYNSNQMLPDIFMGVCKRTSGIKWIKWTSFSLVQYTKMMSWKSIRTTFINYENVPCLSPKKLIWDIFPSTSQRYRNCIFPTTFAVMTCGMWWHIGAIVNFSNVGKATLWIHFMSNKLHKMLWLFSGVIEVNWWFQNSRGSVSILGEKKNECDCDFLDVRNWTTW